MIVEALEELVAEADNGFHDAHTFGFEYARTVLARIGRPTGDVGA